MAFWKMLKIGNDHFETTHLQPKVDVCGRRYVFDAQPPPNSPQPLFDPNAQCPAFVVNPKIARAVLAKERADEAEYAQLVKDNVSVAPIHSGLDGGMNTVFHARYPWKIVGLAIVLPSGAGIALPRLPPVPWADNEGSVVNQIFGALPGAKAASETHVATTDSTAKKHGAEPATTTSTGKPTTKPMLPD
jgi:hypothetical protein